MRQSHLFTKTRREAPKDEVSKNAQLLIRAGFIHKEMAGVYSYLPLGLRVRNRIVDIIREEMDGIGGIEVELTVLQDKTIWGKTDRWSDDKVDNWFKTKLKNDTDLGLGFTHEEPLSLLMSEYVHSYRDLPRLVYQIQTKFRNELRSKSGLMRGREFLMKDLYSFARDTKEHEKLYAAVRGAYTKIFDRAGLGEKTFVTFASGGLFSKYSEEFQTLSPAGEDTIYVDEKKKIAVNKEVYADDVLADLGLSKDSLQEHTSIEVGNIFSLGTRFSEPLGLVYKDEKGAAHPVIMGSYGIGVGRLMGTIVELFSDEKSIVWPESVAPYTVHLLELSQGNEKVKEYADEIYEELSERGAPVLYDDRDARAGEKFADADLIGIPKRAIISEKTMAESTIEVTDRTTGKKTMVTEAKFFSSYDVPKNAR